jgi:hypothetical protein
MIDKDILEIRLRERLTLYAGLPNIDVVKDSIAAEIIDEINLFDIEHNNQEEGNV